MKQFTVIEEIDREGFNPRERLYAKKGDECHGLAVGSAHEQMKWKARGYEIITGSEKLGLLLKRRSRSFRTLAVGSTP